jgi:hypothetical protein
MRALGFVLSLYAIAAALYVDTIAAAIALGVAGGAILVFTMPPAAPARSRRRPRC